MAETLQLESWHTGIIILGSTNQNMMLLQKAKQNKTKKKAFLLCIPRHCQHITVPLFCPFFMRAATIKWSRLLFLFLMKARGEFHILTMFHFLELQIHYLFKGLRKSKREYLESIWKFCGFV